MYQPLTSTKSEHFQTVQNPVIAALSSRRYRSVIVPLSYPLSLPQSSVRQEALQTIKYNRGDVQDLDPQNAPESRQKGLPQFQLTSSSFGEYRFYVFASTI